MEDLSTTSKGSISYYRNKVFRTEGSLRVNNASDVQSQMMEDQGSIAVVEGKQSFVCRYRKFRIMAHALANITDDSLC
jgi:hypothetical protein